MSLCVNLQSNRAGCKLLLENWTVFGSTLLLVCCLKGSPLNSILVDSNHVSKYITLKATTHINICKRNPQTKCGFHLHFAGSTYNLRIPLTVADSARAHFNDTNVLSFVCGFHKLFWIPQIQLRIPQFLLFSERF